VQAVYLPLPTSLHLEWVLKAAKAMKHVLVEKPVGVTLAEAQAMAAACEEAGVLFMDGVMFMHHERLGRIERCLGVGGGEDVALTSFWGPVSRVTAAFSFPADGAFLKGGNIRCRADGDPLGCLGDLGLYCVRFGLVAMQRRHTRYQKGTEETGTVSPVLMARATSMRRNAAGVPIDCSAEVTWPHANEGGGGEGEGDEGEGAMMTPVPTLAFHCSFLHPLRQTAEVCGAGRTLRCDDFVVR
jgi:hypothetical protein